MPDKINASTTQEWEDGGPGRSHYKIVCGEGTTIGVAVGWLTNGQAWTVIVTL